MAQCPTIADNTQSFCDLQSPTVSSLVVTNNGGGVVWYATATSTTPLSPTTGLVSGEDYFADSTAGTCGVRPSVTVTIYSAPVGGPFQGVCVGVPSEATIPAPGDPNPDIEAIGNNVQWYTTPSGGTPLAPGTILNDNTIYYASQTNPDTGCETSRLAVFVNVGVVPVPTGDETQEFCNDPSSPPTVGDLVASGVNNWYLTSSSAAPLPLSTLLIDGQSYYATTVDPPCESPTRFEVVVTLTPPNNPGTPGTLSICQNLTATTGPVNLFSLLGGNPQNTGTWSGPVPVSNGFEGTVDVSGMTVAGSPYVFTYTVAGICAPANTTVTINILPVPTAAIASNQTICSGSTATVTFSGTPNSTVTYTINGGANQTIALNASGSASINQTYTTTTVYSLVSVTSPGPNPCSQPVAGTVTVTVLPLPVATIAANATVCSGQSATVTFTGTPNSTVTYTVNGGAAQTIVLNASGTATISNAFSATTTYNLVSVATQGTPSCSRLLNGSVTITVVPPPTATISGNVNICPNSPATVTFNGTPNATVTYTVNGGPNQTILLNASGTATLTQNYTATTVYTLVSVTTAGTPACSQPASGTVTVTVLPLPAATIASSSTICSGQSASATITGTPNATVTYTVNGGPNQTIVLNASGTATITGTYSATTVISLVSVASAGTPRCSQPITGSIAITVLPLPVAAISANSTVCSGQPASVTFTGTPNATITYTVNGTSQSINLGASGSATITQNYTATTTYTLVSAATSGVPSCSQPVSGTVTITVLPLPVATVSANATICSGATSPVTFTGTPNATVTYTVNGGPNQTITLNASGTAVLNNTYTATTVISLVSAATSGTPVCSQPLTGSVTITVQPLPVVAISANATICSGNSASVTFTGTANATVTYNVNGGANQTIVLNASGTATITQNYTATTTYTLVSAATSGTPACSQPQTGSITITVIPPPTATLSLPVPGCAGSVSNLTINGTPNATVTYTVNGGAPQTVVLSASGTATISGTYTANTTVTLVNAATAGTPVCVQPLTQSVTIPVTPLPTAAISGTTIICPGASATVTFTGTPNSVVTYTVNGGSAQTISIGPSGTATITQNFDAQSTYTLVSSATQGTPVCSQPVSGSVTISVLPPPTVSIAGNTTICAGDSASVTFTGTPNAVILYTVNGGPQQTIVLDASGSAVLTNSYASTTIISLISAATSEPPACVQPQTGSVTITVIPPPAVAISGSASVCPNGSATVTFTGTPNATVTYTVNGATQSIVLNASGTATVTGNYAVTTVFSLVSISVSGTPSCPATVSGTATITVIALPVAAISVASSQVCAGSTALVTFTGTPNSIVTYNINGGASLQVTLNASGTATISPAFVSNATISLVSVSTSGTPACSQPATGSVTVNAVQPPQAGADVASYSLCANGAPVNLFTLLGPAAQAGGTWSPALTSGTGIFNPVTDAPGTYTYTVTGSGTCPADSATVTVTLIPAANAGLDAVLPVCTNSGPVNIFTLLGSEAQSGGSWSPNLSNPGFFNPATDAPGVYTYTVPGNAPCGGDTATVTVNLIQAPNAGTSTTLAVCGNGAPTDLFLALGPQAQPGGTWSPALASGTGFFNPAVDPAGTYIYTLDAVLPCMPVSASVTVNLVSPPNAGSDAIINICSNIDQQDLFAALGPQAQTGGSWSPALASGSGIFNPALDAAGNYTYTVAGTAPCGSDSAVVTVNITPGPDAGQDGALVLCVDSAPQNLFDSLNGNPQTGGNWTPALSGGNGIFNPAVDAPGVYTYTFLGNQPCDNDTATVTVTVNPVPDAGVDGTAFFCTNHPPADLLNSLGADAQAGGTWSPALASGTGVFNPLVDAPGVYTYTVGGGFCTTDTSTVTVTVLQSPNAGGNGAPLLITACQTNSAVDLFTGLNGSQGMGTWADNDNTNALSGSIFDATAVGAGTYHFTYTVGGGVSPCLFDTATVTVVVEPLADAGMTPGPQTFCTSEGTANLDMLLNGAQPGGTWTNASGDVMEPIVDITGFSAGDYSYTYTVNNSCGTDAETVVISILPIPSLSIQNITLTTPICLGENANITISSVADGTYTLNYSLSGANVLQGQSATVTVSGGTGSFAIPAASLVNIGTTTISFDSILNTVSGCSAVLTGILVNVVVRPISDFSDVNLSASGACPGQPVAITINGAPLADGNYQFSYTVAGGNPETGMTGIVAIASGSGIFGLAGSTFPSSGNYQLTITGITSLSSGCGNPSENASTTIVIYNAPDVSGAQLSAANVCSGLSNTIQITGADNLVDGNFDLTYQLGGNASASATVPVAFANGSASFTIPASQLPSTGTVTVTVTQLLTSPGACGAVVTGFNVATFEISEPETPTISPQGHEFCADDNPTLADLAANVQGGAVIWYDAATAGNVLAPNTPLQNGQSYYAAISSGAGCESPVRLEVVVDTTVCEEQILIPDGFSPNGDNINDAFEIVNIREAYPNFKIEIYNRYGNILYKGNANVPDWDGTASQGGLKVGDGVVPTGVYFYILEFNDGVRKPQQGRLYLSR